MIVRGLPIVVLLSILLCTAARSEGLPEVKSIHIGFGNHYKLGCWTPVEVTLSGAPGDSGASGRLDVSALDGDAVPVWFTGPNIIWTMGQTCTAYAKIGRGNSPIQARLTRGGSEGEHLPELLSGPFKTSDSAANPATVIPATSEFIVELGTSVGLSEMFSRLQQRQSDRSSLETATVVTLKEPQTLPHEWFGYEGVDLVAIVGQAAVEKLHFESGPAGAASIDALEHWVRLGGELLIVCGEAAPRVFGKDSPLARFAPGELEGVITLPATASNFGPIESFANTTTEQRLVANSLHVPQWRKVRGRIELSSGVQQGALPLIVRWPLGFGQVTYVGLDLDKPPFVEWPGREAFLERLLGRSVPSGAKSTAPQGVAQAKRFGFVDLSGQLRGALDQFDDVHLIPFWAVAALAVLYIAVLGPLNYWIVIRWLKRPQAAWIVLPITIILFGGGAYALANYAKGVDRHVNQVDLVDIDLTDSAASVGLVRGTTWFNVFSPENGLYDVAVKPKSFARWSVSTADLNGTGGGISELTTQKVLPSWFGLSGAGLGGMESKATSAPLFDQSYTIDAGEGTIAGVPISAWSSKGFMARWETEAGGVEADLHAASNRRLQGSITNRMETSLTECMLLYDNWAYPLQTLSPGQTVQVDRRDPIAISTHLTKRRLQSSVAEEITPYDRTNFDVARIVELMMFHEAAGGENYTGLMHRYQRFTDLSGQLKFDRAILVGRGPSGAMIELNGQSLKESELNHHTSVYRFVLPVKPRE